MRHNLLGLNDRNRDIIAYNNFSSYGTNNSDIKRMKQILSKAVSSELTDRQRECVMLYYYANKTMNEVASILSLSKSTVSRHIKAAKLKLKNVAKYY